MRTSLIRLTLGLALVPATQAIGQQAGTPGRPVVVELYTSQACSSCPPADALLTDLARTRPDVLPLAFHVTYWNNLGWQDPFSFQAATDRQRYLAGRRGDDSVYTPEMVVDGTQDLVGSHRGEAEAAIERAKAEQVTAAPMRVSRGQDGALLVEVGRGERPGNGPAGRLRPAAHHVGRPRGEQRTDAARVEHRALDGSAWPMDGRAAPAARDASSRRGVRGAPRSARRPDHRRGPTSRPRVLTCLPGGSWIDTGGEFGVGFSFTTPTALGVPVRQGGGLPLRLNGASQQSGRIRHQRRC